MGEIISKFRKGTSTVEALEQLEKNIEAIEKQRRCNLNRERRFVGTFVVYSLVLYGLVFFTLYFYYLPQTWADRLKYAVPTILVPIIIWGLKRFLQKYFIMRASKNEVLLEQLRGQKQRILDEVMETHTYKKAKDILERFNKDGGTNLSMAEQSTPVMPATDGQELRHRKPATPANDNASTANAKVGPATPNNKTVQNTPISKMVTSQAQQSENSGGNTNVPTSRKYRRTSNTFGHVMRPPGPPMPRPVLPRERSTSERLLEYLIGDGPQNRYALVCRQCHSHNGMAYKEEFDYLNFRCCYCFTFNKARRQRPNAPALDTPPPFHRKLIVNQEPESGTDAEGESETDLESTSDTNRADATRPDANRPDVNRPDANRPDTTRPDTNRPDTNRPDANRPDVNRPDANRPDVNRPDTNRPDTNRPDANRPDANRLDTTRPAANRPDATRPDANRPDATRPDATRPVSPRPDATRPDATRPDATRLDTKMPDVKMSDAKKDD